MDIYLKNFIESVTPKMNPDIVNGLATKYLPMAEQYMDAVFRYAFKNNDKTRGLHYLGCERCTPQEEFYEHTKPRSGKRSVNTGDSYIYSMKYYFEFIELSGEIVKLPAINQYIPFVGEGGTIFLGGSRYFIHPVLSNKVISATSKGIFVNLLRDSINFNRIDHLFYVNDALEQGHIVLTPLYRRSNAKSKIPPTTRARTTAIHYLLAKHGFNEFFNKYFGFVPFVGDRKSINRNTYPPEEYNIYSSHGIRPKSFLQNNVPYTPTNVVFAIPKERANETLTDTFANIFYILDNFPDRLNKDNLNNRSILSILLGHIIFSGLHNEVKLYEDVMKNFQSLDEYLDDIIKEKLAEIGYPCNDFYDLLFAIHANFAAWFSASESINTMYGKELSILYDTLYYLIHSVFSTSFKIRSKLASKPDSTAAHIAQMLRKGIRKGAIFDNTKTTHHKNNMTNIQYSGDSMFFKVTCTLVPQEVSTSSSPKGLVSNPINKLHPSYAEAGGYLAISKSQPIGNGKINPYVKISGKGTILQDPTKVALIEKTKEMMFGAGNEHNVTMFEADAIELLDEE